MTQEEKQLLLKDLCARLPYGIKFPYHIDEDSNHRECDCVATMDTISEDTVEFTYDENGKIRDWSCSIKEVKPYLRPMSSMTREEILHIKLKYGFCYNNTLSNVEVFEIGGCYDRDGNYSGPEKCKTIHHITIDKVLELINYLNSHHFDYRGLIEGGLALEAPEGMYKT